MSELLDVILACDPLVTGFSAGLGLNATVTLMLPKARAKDTDICFDGERVPGVQSLTLNARTGSDLVLGTLRVRRGSFGLTLAHPDAAIQAASARPIELSVVVHDPEDGHEVAKLPFGRVTLGEPVDVGEKYLDFPLLAPT